MIAPPKIVSELQFESDIKVLLEAIYQRFHYDFRSYSMASVKRRIAGALIKLHCDSVAALQEKLLADPAAFTVLVQSLTVQLSNMFRDPLFFHTFRSRIVPELRTYPSFKIWSAGCSAGEEVYSLAIILQEENLLQRAIIYATDINAEALAKAEAGVYSIERLASFSENYRQAGGKQSLSGYYTAKYGAVVFDRALRKNTVFSDHSLATDNVFAEVQVVLCRNVLIYFNRDLQNRALGLFKDALCRRGFLGIGSRETLQFTAHASAFHILSAEDRWYQRN